MRWFRDTIRQSTWLALIALAMNLGLSFGHVHAIDGKVSGRGIATMAASIASPDDGQNQNKSHPNDGHADYLCPICMAATAMANALASAPPALPLELGNVAVDRETENVVALVEPLRGAFQPRGPPIS
ncbi:DUF2946 domain-containing protein [Bradyrhizobium sp. CB82]|uniref:DUF2946 domain-containing protein n=1 Tax=Bradyrhizobium sp. CB82 TaxID=3039159 RepID=UPI0024B1337A|nr:DUF2946 domain-containing protein [Bradyrhizobium sp. CB82]WFU41560.1 DUF2946 domain-containing protein [Bradyrhizobium sp. CB82]